MGSRAEGKGMWLYKHKVPSLTLSKGKFLWNTLVASFHSCEIAVEEGSGLGSGHAPQGWVDGIGFGLPKKKKNKDQNWCDESGKWTLIEDINVNLKVAWLNLAGDAHVSSYALLEKILLNLSALCLLCY